MWRSTGIDLLTIVLIWTLVVLTGCAVSPEQKELRRYCREYGATLADPRCALPNKHAGVPLSEPVLICERHGARRDDAKDCYYMRRSDLESALRRIGL